jgi:hypothetical protein
MAGRGRAALAKSLDHGGIEDRSWQIWKKCQYCGIDICINNNREHKIRQNVFLGMRICYHCDPRAFTGTGYTIDENHKRWRLRPEGPTPEIANRVKFRTCWSVWCISQLHKGRSEKWVKLQTRRFFKEDGTLRPFDPLDIRPKWIPSQKTWEAYQRELQEWREARINRVNIKLKG